MTHFERMQNCLFGDMTQGIPVSFWRHFPLADQSAEGLARATIDWQKQFEFDFVKVMPSSSFCVKDWGCKDQYSGNPYGIRNYTQHIIKQPDDWFKLPVLDPEHGYLGQQIEALRKIKTGLGNAVPIVQSIFNPLSQMENLAGYQTLTYHLERFPEAVLAGLITISKSTALFIQKAAETGIDGIYFIIKHSDLLRFYQRQYASIVSPFDLICLKPAEKLWLNIIHIHAETANINDFEHYPTQILSIHGLHDHETLKNIKSLTSKVLCGGLQRQEVMAVGMEGDVIKQANDFNSEMGSRPFILAAECGLRLDTPFKNIVAAINFTREKEFHFSISSTMP
nr:hypothetical protein [Bacteroidota bacterium]